MIELSGRRGSVVQFAVRKVCFLCLMINLLLTKLPGQDCWMLASFIFGGIVNLDCVSGINNLNNDPYYMKESILLGTKPLVVFRMSLLSYEYCTYRSIKTRFQSFSTLLDELGFLRLLCKQVRLTKVTQKKEFSEKTRELEHDKGNRIRFQCLKREFSLFNKEFHRVQDTVL